MPLQDHHQIVSVDDHLIEHPRVWIDRMPAKYKDAAPQIKEIDGSHVWHYDGNPYPTVGLNAVAGKPREQWGVDPIRFEDMIPGCYDPSERVKDMDLDGIQAALCFPSFPGFAGSTFYHGKNRELAAECVRAWNDFHLEEWCPSAPDRFIPLALLPFWDIDLAVAEARRVAEMGARTISFPDTTVPMGLPSFHTRHWDPLWQVCSELDLPVSLHFGGGGFVPGYSFSVRKGISGNTLGPENLSTPDAPFAVAIALFPSNLMWTTVDLLFSGALQRFPNLKFSLAEGGIGWLPYTLERCDYTWDRHRYYQDIDFDTRPSDLFHEHFWGCFIDDEHGLVNRHLVGIDHIMLEIDYPHSDSNWPNSHKRAAEVLANVPDDEAQKIVETNARELLRFPRVT
jgi:predicted TIM-barrel fold metal-dependent hydrolase